MKPSVVKRHKKKRCSMVILTVDRKTGELKNVKEVAHPDDKSDEQLIEFMAKYYAKLLLRSQKAQKGANNAKRNKNRHCWNQ